MKYTACYTQIENGYMGQLLEWPEVISEGATIEECRNMLADALTEMTIVCGKTVSTVSVKLLYACIC